MSELTAKALSDSRSFENAILERDMRMKKAGWIVAALAGGTILRLIGSSLSSMMIVAGVLLIIGALCVATIKARK